jgi:6-phosphogluconate dehydrogenase
MTNKQAQQQYAIGTVGLGVMGRNPVLNMADQCWTAADDDKDPNPVEALGKESADRDI